MHGKRTACFFACCGRPRYSQPSLQNGPSDAAQEAVALVATRTAGCGQKLHAAESARAPDGRSWLFTQGVEFQYTALQGIMAAQYDGVTLHTLLGLDKRRQAVDGARHERLTRTIQHLRWLVIDEASMLSAHFLAEVECKLRLLLPRQSCDPASEADEAFGGINIILAGDFHQLDPPDNGVALCTPPSSRPGDKKSRGRQRPSTAWPCYGTSDPSWDSMAPLSSRRHIGAQSPGGWRSWKNVASGNSARTITLSCTGNTQPSSAVHCRGVPVAETRTASGSPARLARDGSVECAGVSDAVAIVSCPTHVNVKKASSQKPRLSARTTTCGTR